MSDVANIYRSMQNNSKKPQVAMRVFEGGATRNADDNKLDFEGFLSPLVLAEYAKYLQSHRMQADGIMRTSDNWQNGIPKPVYFKSLLRHVMEAWVLHRSPAERRQAMITALCAVCFNSFGYIFELLREETVPNVKS